MGQPGSLPGGGGADRIGWEDLGRKNLRASVKWGKNSNPGGFLGGLNGLLFRNIWHMLPGRGTIWAYFPHLPSTPSPVTLEGHPPAPLGTVGHGHVLTDTGVGPFYPGIHRPPSLWLD